MLVDRQQIIAVAAGLAVEHLGLHGQPRKVAGERIGGAPHQAKAEIRDLAVRAVAPAQILL